MNGSVFILAVLVAKKVLTQEEANRLKQTLTFTATNDSLNEMTEKVTRALEPKAGTGVEVIDAKDVM